MSGGPTIYRYWDTTLAPVGLFDFNGDGLDASGNGYDLTITNALNFVPGLIPGTRMLQLGPGYARRTEPAWAFTGAMSFGLILLPQDFNTSPTTQYILQFGASGETEDTNYLYGLRISYPGKNVYDFTEHGAGVNETTTFAPANTTLFGTNRPMVLHYVRTAAGDLTLYVDGYAMMTATIANMPTGGGTGALSLGANIGASATFESYCAGLKIFDFDLSPAQVASEATFVSRNANGAWSP